MSLDRRIAAEGGVWYNYDRQFRKLKANSTITQYKWDQREDELFFLALNRRQLFRSESKISGNIKQNKSKHLSCSNTIKGGIYRLSVPHICRDCGGKHPVFKCWVRNGKSETKPRGGGVLSYTYSGTSQSCQQRQRGQSQPGTVANGGAVR